MAEKLFYSVDEDGNVMQFSRTGPNTFQVTVSGELGEPSMSRTVALTDDDMDRLKGVLND